MGVVYSLLVSQSSAGSDLQSTAIFEQLQGHLGANPGIVKKVMAVFQWNITKDGKIVACWSEYSEF